MTAANNTSTLKTIAKPNLLDLVAQDSWIELQPTHGGRVLNSWKKTVVSFVSSKGIGQTPVDQINLCIGKEIIEQLGWSIGDRICVYHNPDFLMQIKLVKSDSNVGYKLKKLANTKNGNITFRWAHKQITLREVKSKSVEHVVFKKILLIDLNEEKKD